MNLRLTEHACEQYVRRVKPHLTPPQAKTEIFTLAKVAGPPVPSLPYLERGDLNCFLEIAPGIALGLRQERDQFIALTCLIRAEGMEGDRRRKRAEKQIRKHRARAQKNREKLHRKTGRAKDERTYGVGWPD